ncbi:MAG: hypothetical protein ACK5NB_08015 [Flavobacteriaceae bacterium]
MSTKKALTIDDLLNGLTAFHKHENERIKDRYYLTLETYPSHYLMALKIKSLINVSSGCLQGIESNIVVEPDLWDVINTLEIADKLLYALLGDFEVLDELQKIKFPDLDN